MANGKVASYRMEIRMAIADAMVNGRDYGEIREYLAGCGMEAGELPSDHSLRTYEESVEYRTVYQDRVDACNLQLQAGRVAGCASARVSLIQERVLRTWEDWMEADAMSAADIYKVFSLTLQYKRQELAERKLALQEGQPMIREALGPQEFSASTLDGIMDRLAAERAAAAAEEADAADAMAGAAAEANAFASVNDEVAAVRTEDAGYPSIPEDQGGSMRIPEERAVSAKAQEAGSASESAPADDGGHPDRSGGREERRSIPGERVASGRIPQDQGGYPSRPEAGGDESGVPEDDGGRPGVFRDRQGSRSIPEDAAGSRRDPQHAVG